MASVEWVTLQVPSSHDSGGATKLGAAEVSSAAVAAAAAGAVAAYLEGGRIVTVVGARIVVDMVASCVVGSRPIEREKGSWVR